MEMRGLLQQSTWASLTCVFLRSLKTPGLVRFDDYRYDLNFYKRHIGDWMKTTEITEDALFLKTRQYEDDFQV
jgi:hypothetical protein